MLGGPMPGELEQFFALSPDLCCVLGFDGAFVATNPAWSSVLGYAAGELAGRSYIELIHPDDRKQTELELARHTRSTFTNRCVGKDGGYRVLRWHSQASLADRTVYAIGRAEATTMSRTERLQSLGQIALGVVHDLKNVLVHPLGLQLQRAERALEANAGDRAQLAIDAMRDVLRDGLEAIERLLAFSGPKKQATFAPAVDLDAIVWRATEISRAYALSSDALRDVQLDCQTAAKKRIEADTFELLAALVNVMFNGVDAAAERGRKVAIKTGQANRHVWVSVTDDGPGMTPEVRARIFEPFFTTKPDGIGLGLPMVQACVERHGGVIIVDSTPGLGTTLRIELPLR
jgi:PAS domain S-box-containing protein